MRMLIRSEKEPRLVIESVEPAGAGQWMVNFGELPEPPPEAPKPPEEGAATADTEPSAAAPRYEKSGAPKRPRRPVVERRSRKAAKPVTVIKRGAKKTAAPPVEPETKP